MASQQLHENVIPQIIRTTTNKDGSISVVWKLLKNSNTNVNTELKLECAEDEKQLDMNCIKSEHINIGNIKLDSEQETIIKIDNIKCYGGLCFKLSKISYLPVTSIEFEKRLNDAWNSKQKGDLIEVNGNVIKGPVKENNWNSIYGTKICESPHSYHWRFKLRNIDKDQKPHFKIGVINSEQTNLCATSTSAPGIFYHNSANGLYIYGTQYGNITLDQGCKNFNKPGDVLDMWLDLKEFRLTYSLNGNDLEIPIKMPKQKYILIASLYGKVKEIELMSSYWSGNN
eukprot:527284_1